MKDPFEREEQKQFNAAYRARPELNAVVLILYCAVFLCLIAGAVNALSGRLGRALGYVLFSGVSYLGWRILHNWALNNPSDGNLDKPTDSARRNQVAKKIRCPGCGAVGEIAPYDDVVFAGRGRLGNKSVAKCRKCGGGILFGVISMMLLGRVSLIRPEQWKAMEQEWEARFGPDM